MTRAASTSLLASRPDVLRGPAAYAEGRGDGQGREEGGARASR